MHILAPIGLTIVGLIVMILKNHGPQIAQMIAHKLMSRKPESQQVAKLKAELAKEKAKNADV